MDILIIQNKVGDTMGALEIRSLNTTCSTLMYTCSNRGHRDVIKRLQADVSNISHLPDLSGLVGLCDRAINDSTNLTLIRQIEEAFEQKGNKQYQDLIANTLLVVFFKNKVLFKDVLRVKASANISKYAQVTDKVVEFLSRISDGLKNEDGKYKSDTALRFVNSSIICCIKALHDPTATNLEQFSRIAMEQKRSATKAWWVGAGFLLGSQFLMWIPIIQGSGMALTYCGLVLMGCGSGFMGWSENYTRSNQVIDAFSKLGCQIQQAEECQADMGSCTSWAHDEGVEQRVLDTCSQLKVGTLGVNRPNFRTNIIH